MPRVWIKGSKEVIGGVIWHTTGAIVLAGVGLEGSG